MSDINTSQRDLSSVRSDYLDAARELYRDSLATLADDLATPSRPLIPTIIDDGRSLTATEIDSITADFYGRAGVAAFLTRSWDDAPTGRHVLLDICAGLAENLPTKWPVDHPMEGHTEAVSRFGPPDGTLKIYDLPVPIGGPRYREQAETNEAFDAHNDGLGYAGLIKLAALFLDSPPAWGGYTYFANVVRSSLALYENDPEAFESLFLPDAISCLRPRGKGAILVRAPVLYLGPDYEPRCFLRVASGEYSVTWRDDHEAIRRARKWCESLVQPFANGSTFVHLMTPGEGVLIRNQHVIHGRTPFFDFNSGRRLARKWFVAAADERSYRHVPSLVADSRYYDLFPEQFNEAVTHGDWTYDADAQSSVLVSAH